MPAIGRDIAPPDLLAKITGRAKYAEDFRAEGMVFAKLLLSPVPHGRIRRIDASAALRLEGVLGILTADDVPQATPPRESPLTNEPLYQGEPILAVAAVDETTAASAIELIDVDIEPLPFALDPLDSLRPGGPNARLEGNTLFTDQGRGIREVREFKWRDTDFQQAAGGRLPMGEPETQWERGDVEAGFAEADLILEETLAHQSLTHHPLEPRSCMAYWQNGRLHFFGSTQSTARAHSAMASLMGLRLDEVVFVGEYCGGGFGSKISVQPLYAVPALLSRKIGRPVMLRISRAEETYVGRGRPGFQSWVKIGFRADGRPTALDLYIVQDHGPYGRSGDLNTAAEVASLSYQPLNMRFRGVSVFTNTPPRSAQRMPGGEPIVAMLEPLMDRAARALGIDRVEMRILNSPDSTSRFGPEEQHVTSMFAREAIRKGAEIFGWTEKSRLSGQRNGTLRTGIGIGCSPFHGGSSGYDGLVIIRPDGKLYVHQGIGNLGTHSFADTARVAADLLGISWENVQVLWGDTSKHLPWSSSQAGSQTTHAHTRANHAAAMDLKRKLQQIAARDLGGSPSSYEVGDQGVFQRGNPSVRMSLRGAAERAIELGGIYDGHELPSNLHEMTAASASSLAGQGAMGVAKDTYEHDGETWSFVVGFVVVDVDEETGDVHIREYTAVTDCGTVLHPRSVAAQIHGGAVQGFGTARSQKWVMDPQWGASLAQRFYSARPPGILDVPLEMGWAALDTPDPQNPVGSKGIGEPPIGAGAAAIVSAISDALGGKPLFRTPLTTDVILAAMEDQPAAYGVLEAHV